MMATCNHVPSNQAINTNDGTDRVVGNVEHGEDDVDEGEEQPNHEECLSCDDHAMPHHVRT